MNTFLLFSWYVGWKYTYSFLFSNMFIDVSTTMNVVLMCLLLFTWSDAFSMVPCVLSVSYIFSPHLLCSMLFSSPYWCFHYYEIWFIFCNQFHDSEARNKLFLKYILYISMFFYILHFGILIYKPFVDAKGMYSRFFCYFFLYFGVF